MRTCGQGLMSPLLYHEATAPVPPSVRRVQVDSKQGSRQL